MLERWGAVLARPELQRFPEAATYFEQAALKSRTPLQAVLTLNRAQAVLAAARPVPAGRTPDFPVRAAASRAGLERLALCVAARRPVVLAMVSSGGGAGLASHEVKAEAYRCPAALGGGCEGCRAAGLGLTGAAPAWHARPSSTCPAVHLPLPSPLHRPSPTPSLQVLCGAWFALPGTPG